MENNSNKRIKIFSHESDIDGLGNIILGKIAFGEIEYELFPDPQNLTKKMMEYIQDGSLHVYDKIYITDLSLYPPAIEKVNQDEILKGKMIILDHHKGAIDAGCGQYEFSHVMIRNETGKKTCGTELFYQYLSRNAIIQKTPLLDMFVELTRLEDTWEWGENGEVGCKAHDLSILFNAMPKEEYIESMLQKLSQEQEMEFQFNEEEKKLIQEKKQRWEEAIQKAIQEIEYMIDELGNRFGIVYADYECRNDIPEYIRKIGNPEKIQYLIIAAMDKGETGQKSYRLIADGFDVNEIAKLHGGGGHASAAAVPITIEQKEKALSMPKKEGLTYLARCVYE